MKKRGSHQVEEKKKKYRKDTSSNLVYNKMITPIDLFPSYTTV